MNKFLEFLKSKGLNSDTFKALEVEKQADIQNEYLAHIEENSATKSELKSAKAEMLKAIKDEFEAQASERGTQTFVSLKEQLRTEIDKNMDAIKSIIKNKSGSIEIEVKAPVAITTATGVNTGPPAITGTQQAPLTAVNLRNMGVLPLTTQFTTNNAAFAYTEASPKDGDFLAVAEGTLKPQIDFTWETNYAKPVKVAAYIRLTEEAVDDVEGLVNIAEDYLQKKHDLKKSKLLLFGTGVLPQPKGATLFGRVFSAGALALSVSNPNFMDVVNAAITDIATTHNYEDEMPYMASIVLVNPNDFFINLVAAKTADGVPLYPNASLFNQVNIGGVTIVPEESIPAGKIFVCDMAKYNTTNYKPYTVRIGYGGTEDDFLKNQFVMIGESRFHAFVKKLDEQAFIYDNIATIKTAITKPA